MFGAAEFRLRNKGILLAEHVHSAVDIPRKRMRRWVRVTLWVGVPLLLLAAAAFTVFAIYFERAEPILRDRVVETLEARYDSRVELAGFNVSVWRGFEVTGSGLKLYPNHLSSPRPLISAKKFRFRATWRDLFQSPMHIGLVHIDGLDLFIPPTEESGAATSSGNAQKPPKRMELVVDRLEIDHASLVLGTNKPGKIPLDFQVANLTMTTVGAGLPMRFHATLINPKPIGDIDSSGTFGPFNEKSPANTRVSGVYTFRHVNLNPLKGIGGMLSSAGKYAGTLNNITVDGETDTPNFSLDTAGHSMPLHTTFHAIVDGTNGDTHLEPVDAVLAHSHIVARGDVVKVPGQGRLISLDVTMGPARIEDILALAVKTEPPVMTGALALHTSFVVPPGNVSVTGKMKLRGNFQITDAHFTEPKMQAKINELSLRGQGLPQQANEDARHNIDPEIGSDMRGNFVLDKDRITITGLNYAVPGANIAMNGVYTLDGNEVNFHGTARLKAKVSQMVTGWKSLLLKAVDPFFAKDGAGTEVPISITGTRSNLHFGIEFLHKDSGQQKPPSVHRIP